jgi:hypothetical protein
VQAIELGIGHVGIHHGHAARRIAELRQRIERAGVVGAVGRWRDDHRARGAQALLQQAVGRHLGLRRRARPVRRGREARVEDVHVAVAGAVGQRAPRAVQADGMRHGLARRGRLLRAGQGLGLWPCHLNPA